MDRKTKKLIKRIAVTALAIVLLIAFPMVILFWIICGIIDFSRNKHEGTLALKRYFTGNGILTWALSPINLFLDLISHKNPGIYKLEDFPTEYREEIETVLDVFKERKGDIMADIDEAMGENARGMYIYKWYGKQYIDNVPEFNQEFKHLKTIAVSVFSGKESTSWHYGPVRMSIRVLFNLTPVEMDNVFIECQDKKHLWYKDQFYAFDDTLFHRSVNEAGTPRYVVFMDIARPSYFPKVITTLMVGFSVILERFKSMFYKNWKMLDRKK